MPIYEEKLISPFAVRFTQDHIRTTFRDHRSVEAAVDLVEASLGEGSYDVILKHPFPSIEVLRWHPRRRGDDGDDSDAGSSGESYESGGEPSRDHWFTLDNRRLYCLQRAAAHLWPKRVAAVVEVLYVDPGSVMKKYDSKTAGRAVSIAHSLKGPELAVWDWRKSVMALGAVTGTVSAVRAVQVDDEKESIEDLADAPHTGGLMAMLAAEAERRAQEQTAEQNSVIFTSDASLTGNKAVAGYATPSTADSCASSDGSQADTASDTNADLAVPSPARVRAALAGRWVGSNGETYEITFGSDIHWQCVRTDAHGLRKFTLYYENETGLVWWGIGGRFFLDALQVVASSTGQLAWYVAGDMARRKPRFTWLGLGEEEFVESGYDVKAADAIDEILAQLNAAGGSTHQLWVPEWAERYQPFLGSVRRFIESRPDKFIVTPGKGRQFTVSVPAGQGKVRKGPRREQAGQRSGSGPIGTPSTQSCASNL